MTVLVQKAQQIIFLPRNKSFSQRELLGILLAVGMTYLALSSTELGSMVRTALSDAYLQVSVFVSVTLLLFYGLENYFKLDTIALLNRYRSWQVPIAAALGMLPGCGGAIMVMTTFVRGGISFGSVVAALTSTMGDAAFILIAQRPMDALVLLSLSMGVGLLSGLIVDYLHGPHFLQSEKRQAKPIRKAQSTDNTSPIRTRDAVWFILSIPGLMIGILLLAQVDFEPIFSQWGWPAMDLGLGIVGGLLAFIIWGTGNTDPQTDNSRSCYGIPSLFRRIAEETSFVTIWVVFAFLAFEVVVGFLGVELETMFSTWTPLLPLLAVVIGLIPGCGPQIIVTTLYINGSLPFSALMGNAISNDGDALFPALAMAPRSAVLATLYSTIPALIVAYGIYFLMES